MFIALALSEPRCCAARPSPSFQTHTQGHDGAYARPLDAIREGRHHRHASSGDPAQPEAGPEQLEKLATLRDNGSITPEDTAPQIATAERLTRDAR